MAGNTETRAKVLREKRAEAEAALAVMRAAGLVCIHDYGLDERCPQCVRYASTEARPMTQTNDPRPLVAIRQELLEHISTGIFEDNRSPAHLNASLSDERAEKLLAEYEAALAAEPAPVGTREPTEEMVEAGARADYEHVFEGVDKPDFNDLAPALRRVNIDSARRVLSAALASPSAGGVTGQLNVRAAAMELAKMDGEEWDKLEGSAPWTYEQDAIRVLRAAGAEQPRTVERDYLCNNCGEMHPIAKDCPKAAAPVGSPAPEQERAWSGSPPGEVTVSDMWVFDGQRIHRPAPEPRTQERETLEVSIADLIIETEAQEGFLRPGMFSVRAPRLARHIAALRTPAPSGDAEPRAWLREYRNRDGEWIPNHLSLDRPPPSDHPQIRDTPLYAHARKEGV